MQVHVNVFIINFKFSYVKKICCIKEKKNLENKTNLKIYFLTVVLEENQNKDIKKKIFKKAKFIVKYIKHCLMRDLIFCL